MKIDIIDLMCLADPEEGIDYGTLMHLLDEHVQCQAAQKKEGETMTTRRIVRASIVAALYAALTVVVAPLSYGPVQFRVAEILKPLALFDPAFIFGFALGNFLSNITSPYAGPWEWVFMPTANLVGASACWLLRRWPYAGAAAYAAVITLAVSTMLHFVLGAPWWALAWSVGVSEGVLIVGGVELMKRVWGAVETRLGHEPLEEP